MGESVTKAMLYGVGIFITMMIISGIMYLFSQVRTVYTQIEGNDTSISSKFSEYAMYENTTITGLEVINCANKYYNKNLVVVEYNGMQVNNESGIEYLNLQFNEGNITYDQNYKSIVEEILYDGIPKTTIKFEKK